MVPFSPPRLTVVGAGGGCGAVVAPVGTWGSMVGPGGGGGGMGAWVTLGPAVNMFPSAVLVVVSVVTAAVGVAVVGGVVAVATGTLWRVVAGESVGLAVETGPSMRERYSLSRPRVLKLVIANSLGTIS